MPGESLNIPAFNQRNLFVIPYNDSFSGAEGDSCMIYSPLSKNVQLLSYSQVKTMELFLSGELPSDTGYDIQREISEMIVGQIRPDYEHLSCFNTDDINRMAILPTFNCNFSCSYCYSAQGRSQRSLTPEKLKTAIDYFISPARTSRRDLYLTIVGGGEPLLEKELVIMAIKYAAGRAKSEGFKLTTGLTTNGSLVDDDVIKLLKEFNVETGISFEVLEHLQQQERGNYELVAGTVTRLVNEGLRPAVKAIIKKDNVDLILKMVSELVSHFPGVRELKLQPIDSPDYFSSPGEMRAFYDNFLTHLVKAAEEGRKHNILVYCTMLGFGLNLKEHYCGGELCITPDGEVTLCHRFSSASEKQFRHVHFGSVSNSCVVTDDEKFTSVMQANSMLRDECLKCFARFHCSGGCIAQSIIFDASMRDEVCRFNRLLIRYQLRERLNGNQKVIID